MTDVIVTFEKLRAPNVLMHCHGASEFEQSRLTQFNFKALLNKAKYFISKPPSCLVLMSVVYFILGGLWPQIKSNTKSDKKSMYLQHWHYAGILKINDVFDTQQNCFPSFDSFRNRFNVRCNFLQYFNLVNAIPQSWKKTP